MNALNLIAAVLLSAFALDQGRIPMDLGRSEREVSRIWTAIDTDDCHAMFLMEEKITGGRKYTFRILNGPAHVIFAVSTLDTGQCRVEYVDFHNQKKSQIVGVLSDKELDGKLGKFAEAVIASEMEEIHKKQQARK